MTVENKDMGKDIDGIIADFKAEFVTEESVVLDAWYEDGFLMVYIDGLRMADEDAQAELENVPAPGEYNGLDTMLTLFDDREAEAEED